MASLNLKCFTTLADGKLWDHARAVLHQIPEENTTVENFVDRVGIPLERVKVILLNGRVADWDRPVHDGDSVSLVPPDVGGM